MVRISRMSGSAENPDRFVEDVARFIDERKLLAADAVIVAGVSGGADSVAMLAVLRELAGREGRRWRITVAHLDHGLRPESAEDAAFVRQLAERWDLPCVIDRRDTLSEAERGGCGIEEAARELRYAFLADAARSLGAGYVAVGHNRDDNVETVLHRIVRGTHLRGLGGIAERRELGCSGVVVVRPLLACTRESVERFCRSRELAWRDDRTNAETSFRRNFIRHELLPLLRERLNLRSDEALLRLAEGARETEAFLARCAEQALRQAGLQVQPGRAVLDASVLADEPLVLSACALREAMASAGVPMKAVGRERIRQVAELLQAPSGAVALPEGFVARREGARLVITREVQNTPSAGEESVPLNCPGRTALPDGRVVACYFEPFDAALLEAHRSSPAPGCELLDAGRTRPPLCCRPRRDGDSFVPLGAPGTRSVSDFLTDLKLTSSRRAQVRCICDELGIVYVAPLRIENRVRLTDSTRWVLRVTIRPDFH